MGGQGGALPKPSTVPGTIDRSWKPPMGSTVAKGPDGYWRHVIRPGDIGTTLAQWYSGSVYNTAQLEKTNPELVRVNGPDGQPKGWSPWMAGQVLVLPLNWDGSKGPAPGLGGQALAAKYNSTSPWLAPSTRNAQPMQSRSFAGPNARQAAPTAPTRASFMSKVAQRAPGASATVPAGYRSVVKR
jgi:hypothetical protein